jgi:hypothetical protein
MKKILLYLLVASSLFGAAGDIKIDRKNSSDNAWIATIFAKQNNAIIGTDSSGVPGFLNGITWSSPTLSVTPNAALSSPSITSTGSWFTGGSSTTTKPAWLLEPTGTTSTGWSTSGTGLGINATAAFAGNLLDAQVGGGVRATIFGTGIIRSYRASTAAQFVEIAGLGTNTSQNEIYSNGVDKNFSILNVSTSGSTGNNIGFYTGVTGTVTQIMQIQSTSTKNAWGAFGAAFNITGRTYTDNSTAVSGTAVLATFNSFGIPTLAATNATVTTTDSVNLYVAGAPIQSTNQTLTRVHALMIAGGNSQFNGPISASYQALSGAGAVNVTQLTTEYTSTGASQALTLADGYPGQLKTIIHGVDGGSGILTPTTKTGYTTITFTNVGESATLQFLTTRGWIIISLRGAVAA